LFVPFLPLSFSNLSFIVNDTKNFAFGLAKAFAYGFCKDRKQNFVMSFTIFLHNPYQPFGDIGAVIEKLMFHTKKDSTRS